MKRCPVCNREYNDNEKICDDCGEILKECKSEQITECVLVRCESQIQSRIYQQMLKNNSIPFYTTSGQFGGVSSLYMGYSVFGEDIIVSSDDYERAYILIYNEDLPKDDNSSSATPTIEKNEDDVLSDKDSSSFNGRKQVCKIVIWVVLGINALALFLLLVSNFLRYFILRKIL